LVYSKTNIKPEFLDGVLVGYILVMCEGVNPHELQLMYLKRRNMDNLRQRVVDFRSTSISLEWIQHAALYNKQWHCAVMLISSHYQTSTNLWEDILKIFARIRQYCSEQSIVQSVKSGCMKTVQVFPKPEFNSDVTHVPKILTNLIKLERSKEDPCRDIYPWWLYSQFYLLLFSTLYLLNKGHFSTPHIPNVLLSIPSQFSLLSVNQLNIVHMNGLFYSRNLTKHF
jgi:hypothetical protein